MGGQLLSPLLSLVRIQLIPGHINCPSSSMIEGVGLSGAESWFGGS